MTALVLLYHGIREEPLPGLERFTLRPSTFREHLQVVTSSGRPLLTFAELVARRRAGTCPPDPVVITIDDGFADAVDAVRLASTVDVPGSLFVTTSLLGQRHMALPHQLPGLIGAGWEVGSHGVSHRRLDEVAGPTLRRELRVSRTRLEEILGASVTSFAYPHGNHTRRCQQAARDAGYDAAAAVRDTVSTDDESPWSISRRTVTSEVDAPQLERWLAGGEVAPRRTPAWMTTGYRAVRRVRALGGGSRDELAEILARAG